MEAVTASMEAAATGTTDEALVAAAREGDHGAFRGLYERHAGRLFAFLLRACGDRADAEETLQDAFVKAWQRLGQFGGRSRFSTWLASIAVNELRASRRARARRERRLAGCPDPDLLAAAAPGPAVEELADLERAVAGLPPRARMVFVLATVGDYRHDEIAGIMGIAPGTCKAQLHRARKLLARRLAP
jgi:RNA polymerase sigma-70 factor (ECF subfamily)